MLPVQGEGRECWMDEDYCMNIPSFLRPSVPPALPSLPLRYSFTMLSPLARLVFPPPDDHQLTYLREDNMRIEPEWYCPILPMVLVNGSDGIGTGYSTTVPNYDPREIVGNIKRMMNGLEPTEMVRQSDTKYV